MERLCGRHHASEMGWTLNCQLPRVPIEEPDAMRYGTSVFHLAGLNALSQRSSDLPLDRGSRPWHSTEGPGRTATSASTCILFIDPGIPAGGSKGKGKGKGKGKAKGKK